MNIVAIDPSFRNMAFIDAVYELKNTTPNLEITGYHLEQTAPGDSGGKRENDWLASRQLAGIIETMTDSADIVFIEQPVGSQSARSAWTLGITLGLLAAIRVPVLTLSARQVKQGFTGDPKATKIDMIAQAQKVFPYVDLPKQKFKGKRELNLGKSEHIADAMGVLFVGVKTHDFISFYDAESK